MATLNSLDYRLHIFDGCILLFLKVLFSCVLLCFVVFFSTMFAAIVFYESHIFWTVVRLNTPRVETLVAVTSLLAMLYHIFMSGGTVAQSQKDQSDLELIKRSITRLWISFNFLIIRLIVWANDFVVLSTYSSSVLHPFLSCSSSTKPQTPSVLIYFVSPFTPQKLVSSLAALPSLISLIFPYLFPPPLDSPTPSYLFS